VALVNHFGQNGTAFHPAVRLADIPLRMRTERPVRSVRLLRAEQPVKHKTNGPWTECTVPRLDRFEVVLFDYA
jgi:hypothetical protein